MKKLALLFTLLLCVASLKAQNASPLGGVGSLQVFDNTGAILPGAVFYIYNAGTTTLAPVYSDSTATTQLPNPVTLGSGARASIWLANGQFFKIVLCQQNDGSACAPGDVIFSADQVPIGSTASSGNNGTFTGVFISSTASPATSGTLRLASGDSVCWRNAAGSANLCIKKDSNDLFSLDSGSWKLPEVGAPSGVAGFDILWADNTAHRLKAVNNAGTAAQYVLSGNDVSTSDAVTAVHFGANQQTLGSTAPTNLQTLQSNGTQLNAYTSELTLTLSPTGNGASAACAQGSAGVAGDCIFYTFGAAHTLTRLIVNVLTAPVGCSTSAVYGVRDYTSSTNLLTFTPSTTGVVTTTGSVTIPASDNIGIGLITQAVGCSTFVVVTSVTGVYE